MSKFIGFEREDEAIKWARQRMGVKGEFGFCRALSLVDDYGNFLFVVVLSNFSARNIDIHQAGVPTRKWATPRAFIEIFNAAFGYVFETHKAVRVTGLVKSKNTITRNFVEHLGLKLEGIMKDVFENDDLCIYAFLKEDFRNHKWFRG